MHTQSPDFPMGQNWRLSKLDWKGTLLHLEVRPPGWDKCRKAGSSEYVSPVCSLNQSKVDPHHVWLPLPVPEGQHEGVAIVGAGHDAVAAGAPVHPGDGAVMQLQAVGHLPRTLHHTRVHSQRAAEPRMTL